MEFRLVPLPPPTLSVPHPAANAQHSLAAGAAPIPQSRDGRKSSDRPGNLLRPWNHPRRARPRPGMEPGKRLLGRMRCCRDDADGEKTGAGLGGSETAELRRYAV